MPQEVMLNQRRREGIHSVGIIGKELEKNSLEHTMYTTQINKFQSIIKLNIKVTNVVRYN
jgi:hypothetical protein